MGADGPAALNEVRPATDNSLNEVRLATDNSPDFGAATAGKTEKAWRCKGAGVQHTVVETALAAMRPEEREAAVASMVAVDRVAEMGAMPRDGRLAMVQAMASMASMAEKTATLACMACIPARHDGCERYSDEESLSAGTGQD